MDDEAWYVDALAQRLDLRGFRAEVAFDGRSGLRRLGEQPFDAMVLDLKLPDMSGLEVLCLARRQWPELRVLILTGHGSDAERQACLERGAEAFINKPIRTEELAALLRGEEERS